MNVIHDIQHHLSPPISLDDQPLNPITQHIIFFLDFLEAYSPPPVANDNDEESADPLEMRIANAAFAAEDAIESHIADTIRPMDPMTANDEKIKSINLCRDRLQSVIKDMDTIKNLMVVTEEKKKKMMMAKEIDMIKNLMVDTEEKKKMVAVHDQHPMKSIHASVSCKETIVGLEAASREIMERLTGDRYSNLLITPIVGMGGIGKTFLAKTIYEALSIKDHFYICAWATISQQHNRREILCEILFQTTKETKELLSGMSEDELGLKLSKFLFGRRFLIVLDDMWSVDSWDKIQRFFPNNKTGSRVVVTTRQSQLGFQLNPDYSHRMRFLDKATGWDLFTKTVFGDKSCPLELKEIGEQIVENCRGLPLSIVVVGGLLKKTDDPWESIRDNMSSLVNMENNKHCFKLLKMSYNHLPVYLKPCFLYMGVFEEDDAIRVSTLVKLWVSEGFLKPSNCEALKTTARGLLHDLIDRNLILIDSLGNTGKIKYCKIHDLVRDLCLKEGQKNGLYHVIGKCNLHHQDMYTIRRVVVPNNTSVKKVYDELRFMLRARSVICEYDVYVPGKPGFLRTLHAYKFNQGYFTANVQMIMHALRHVNLRHLAINVQGGGMSSFLNSVSLFWNLQTLILKCLQKIVLLSDFWKMAQFRHIEFVYCSLRLPNIQVDGEFIIMENLHTLIGVSNFKCCQGMVKRIPNLKTLKLIYEGQPEGEYFVENIDYLCRLESLFIQAIYFSAGYYMQRITFPQSLRKLILIMSDDFEWDDMMTKIGLLPLLEHLVLGPGCFKKGTWETVEGQFPCLKYLKLLRCKGLEKWTAAEEGSILPRLEHLRLVSIDSLKEIPLELGNIEG